MNTRDPQSDLTTIGDHCDTIRKKGGEKRSRAIEKWNTNSYFYRDTAITRRKRKKKKKKKRGKRILDRGRRFTRVRAFSEGVSIYVSLFLSPRWNARTRGLLKRKNEKKKEKKKEKKRGHIYS